MADEDDVIEQVRAAARSGGRAWPSIHRAGGGGTGERARPARFMLAILAGHNPVETAFARYAGSLIVISTFPTTAYSTARCAPAVSSRRKR
jgi:hypothetical protein